jgi:hypothetical protein
MPIHTLTDFEKFSITRPYLNELSKINNSSYAISGPIASRIIGIATLPFVSLGDAFLHCIACAGVGMTGIVVSPYNFLAFAFFPEYSKSEDYEFSSSLVHLMMTVESLFNAAILPFLCLLNPDRASRWINARTAKDNLLNESGERIAELQQYYDHSQRNYLSLLNEKNQCQTDLEEKERINQDLNRQLLGQQSFSADEQMRANQLVEEKERGIVELNRQLIEQNQHFVNELSREKNQLLIEKYEVGVQLLILKNSALETERDLQLTIVNLKNENQAILEKNHEIVHQANQERERASEELKKELKEQADRFENQLFRETNHLRIEKSEVNEKWLNARIEALAKEHMLSRRLTSVTNERNQLNEDLQNEIKFVQFTEEVLNDERVKYEELHHKYDTLIEELNDLKTENEELSETCEQRAVFLQSANERSTNTENKLKETILDLRKTVSLLEEQVINK